MFSDLLVGIQENILLHKLGHFCYLHTNIHESNLVHSECNDSLLIEICFVTFICHEVV